MFKPDPKRHPAGSYEDSLVTRHTLIRRIRNIDDEASWQEFFETYWRLIYSVALKAGLSEADAEEIVQETVLNVARKIDGFVYDPSVCSFKTWMLRLTRWRILDRLKQRQREEKRLHRPSARAAWAELREETPMIEQVEDERLPGIDTLLDQAWALNVYHGAIERAKRRVSPDQFQIFDLYVAEAMPARQVAKTLGISVARVYLAKHRVEKVIQKEMERLKREMGAC